MVKIGSTLGHRDSIKKYQNIEIGLELHEKWAKQKRLEYKVKNKKNNMPPVVLHDVVLTTYPQR